MARGKAKFTKSDVVRAIEGARAAGVDVCRVRIRIAPDGSIEIDAGGPGNGPGDDLDRELAEFEARRYHAQRPGARTPDRHLPPHAE